jgi:hypothetical protein
MIAETMPPLPYFTFLVLVTAGYIDCHSPVLRIEYEFLLLPTGKAEMRKTLSIGWGFIRQRFSDVACSSVAPPGDMMPA